MTERPYVEDPGDFPDGDGDAKCPICRGRGVVTVMMSLPGGGKWPGGTSPCECVYRRDLELNVKRIWPVLLTCESTPSDLLYLTKKSLWITATAYDFRRHLRYVAFRMGPNWDARVVTDSKIIGSWLSTVKEAFDADVMVERRETPSNEFFTIEDLAVPFELLIIVLGVKAAKNREMPNVLLEAINERDVRGKPTWVIDSPNNPLQEGHICYNEMVMETLGSFKRVKLSTATTPKLMGFVDTDSPDQPGVGYTKRKPGMVLNTTTPPPPLPGRGIPMPEKVYAEDDLSVDALMANASGLGTVDPDFLEAARAAAAKPKPAGRRKYRPGGSDE